MDYQVGDKVSFLNEKLDGVVCKIVNSNQVEVATDDGFDVPVLTKDLVLVHRDETLKENKSSSEEEERSEKNQTSLSKDSGQQGMAGDFSPDKKIVKKKEDVIGRKEIQAMLKEKMQTKVIGKISLKHSHRRKEVEGEVDLHIENLVDSWKNMSNGEIVQQQLSVARERIDDAILAGKHRLVIIHGVGSGTLKKEVRKLIGTYPGIRFEEGHFSVYGAGATLVHL
jgi:dsDNA-specific endonuclease/ATPase MutS2